MTELTPIRRGRCAGAGNWQTQYQALQMTAWEAAELIRDGDTAAFAAMSNWPWELDGALAERLLETGGHIAIYGLPLSIPVPYPNPSPSHRRI